MVPYLAFEACESGPRDVAHDMVRQLEAHGLLVKLLRQHVPTCCLMQAFKRPPNVVGK